MEKRKIGQVQSRTARAGDVKRGMLEKRRGKGEFWLGTLNWKCVCACVCVDVCVQNALVTQSSIDKQD